ncbi:MAG: S1C family serine protease [Akkermansiaceae bacterium]
MKALALFLSTAVFISAETRSNPFASLWNTEHEATLEKSAINLTPKLKKHTVMIGRLGLLEARPGVILSQNGDILAPFLKPIDSEDDAPYLLYLPDGSRQTLELITEKPKRNIAHLRAKKLPEGALPAERAEDFSLKTSQWFLIPITAPVPHLGEPIAIARDHAFPRPEDDAVTFTLALGPYAGGTPIFDLAGRLLGIQTVPTEARAWKNQARGRVFTIPRIVEDFPELAEVLKSPAEGYLPKLPRNPYTEEEEDEDQEDISPLGKARAESATVFLPSENPPYAAVLNEGKAITHSVTGVIVRSDGLLLTKASELGPDLSVRYEGKTYPATLLATDEPSDLALVGIEANNLPVIQWSENPDLKSGTTLISPILITEIDNEEMSGETLAAIGAFSHSLKNPVTIHDTSAPASLGLITEQAQSILKIASFQKDAPAQEAGLQVGDQLTSLNGTKITDRASLITALAPLTVGTEASLTILRGTETKEVKITLTRPHLSPPPTAISNEEPLKFIPSIRRSGFPTTFVHTLPLDSWECGSPVYTREGKAIGLNIASASHNRSLALPPKEIKAALKRLLSKSRTF